MEQKKYTAKNELITSAALLKNKRYLEPIAKHEMPTTFCLRIANFFFVSFQRLNLELRILKRYLQKIMNVGPVVRSFEGSFKRSGQTETDIFFKIGHDSQEG